MLIILNSIEGKYNIKQKYQNSIRDLLIASTAIYYNAHLISNDNELNRVLIQKYGFEQKDSKGYINRGWQYSFRKGNC